MSSRVLVFAVLLTACGRLHDRPAPTQASPDDGRAYRAAAERVTLGFLEDGQVVSRDDAGGAQRVGDSLTWTGVALGVLPCDLAAPLADRLAARLEANSGLLLRFEPLPSEYAGGDEVSFDGETGVVYGLARFAARCGASPAVAQAYAKRLAAVDAAGGRLHPNVLAYVPAEFTYTVDLLAWSLGIRGEPAAERQLLLEAQLAGWIAVVKATHAACFRANLAYLHLATLEALGRPVSDAGRLAICEASAGLELPTLDHWCGRGGLSEFVAGFQFDLYEFRFQRCAYEGGPDGHGLKSPALDLLMALSTLHGL